MSTATEREWGKEGFHYFLLLPQLVLVLDDKAATMSTIFNYDAVSTRFSFFFFFFFAK